MPKLTGGDFENLLAFRTNLRRFLHWSRTQAHAAGLTPAQHQLLVAIKGHPGGQRPTIGDLASYLLLRHHSAVELVDRAAAAGLVERWSDAQDGRVTRVGLTADGEARLATLAPAHLDELRSLAPVLERLVAGWAAHHPDAPAPAADLGLASPQLARAPGPDAPAGGLAADARPPVPQPTPRPPGP